MKVLVCGGRDFVDAKLVDRILSQLKSVYGGFSCLINGGARGADHLAALWGRRHKIEVVTVPAEWKKFGRAAGPRRNQAMLDLAPDLVVAFPGGRGTADMVRRAKATKVHVIEVQES